MAAATLTPTEYGYLITGDTGAKTVSSGTLRVKLITFSGNADNATAALTTLVNGTAVSVCKFKTNADDLNDSGLFFGERGIPMTGLAVTLSHASDEVHVFIN